MYATLPPLAAPTEEAPAELLLVQLAHTMFELQRSLAHQTIVIAQIQDELAETRRSLDWYNAQFAQMSRVHARDLRELRATLICALLNDGPVSAQSIQTLLRAQEDEQPHTAGRN